MCHEVTVLEERDSWRVLLGSPEIILVSVTGYTFVGGLFTTSSEFLMMLTAKSREGLSGSLTVSFYLLAWKSSHFPVPLVCVAITVVLNEDFFTGYFCVLIGPCISKQSQSLLFFKGGEILRWS